MKEKLNTLDEREIEKLRADRAELLEALKLAKGAISLGCAVTYDRVKTVIAKMEATDGSEA